MSTAIDSKLIQPVTPRASDDRSPKKGDAADGFGDALRSGTSSRRDAPDRPANDTPARWIRLGARLDAAMDAGRRSVPADENEAVAAIADEELEALQAPQSPDDDDDTGDAPVLAALIGLHPAPPPHRAAGKRDAVNDTDPDAAKPRVLAKAPNVEASEKGAQPRATLPTPTEVEAGTPAAATERSVIDADQSSDPTRPRKSDAGDAPKPAARVSVVSQQTFAVPAPPPQTGVLLASAIAATEGLPAAPGSAAVPTEQPAIPVAGAHQLKLQLHPAELGMVTASLRFAGGQLSIELQVENAEAYQRLSSDSDAIVKTLQGLGYEIDRVTVLQPQIATTAAARIDSGPAAAGMGGRGAEASGSGAGGGGAPRQQSGGSGGDARQNDPQPRPGGRDGAGSGLYI